MANDKSNTQHEADHTLLDIVIYDETEQPLDTPYLTCLIDCNTRQVIHCWLEASAAPLSEEPPQES
jgi:hypothetical protein